MITFGIIFVRVRTIRLTRYYILYWIDNFLIEAFSFESICVSINFAATRQKYRVKGYILEMIIKNFHLDTRHIRVPFISKYRYTRF